MSADLLSEFMALSGLDDEEAMKWLIMGEFNLENATELFFGANFNDSNTNIDHNELLSSLMSSDKFNDDNIRVPDAVKRGRLVENDMKYTSNKAAKVSRSAFTSGNGFLPKNDKEATLSEIFRPPSDLMTLENFDGVLSIGKDSDKWLLVNLQRDSEFQCHTLNRDFWSDESVRDMVLCSFVFWQQQELSEDGAIYVDRYKVSSFPHIAIIDPRTGASVWRHDGSYKKNDLAERLQDFLGSHPVPSEWRGGSTLFSRKLSSSAPRHGSSSSSSGSGNSIGGLATTSTSIDSGSKHESYSDSVDVNKNNKPSVQSNEHKRDDSSSAAAAAANPLTQLESTQKPSSQEVVTTTENIVRGFRLAEYLKDKTSATTISESSSSTGSSTSASASTIKIMFKLPTGMKALHIFDEDTSLEDVVHYVAQLLVKWDPSLLTSKDYDNFTIEIFYDFPQKLLSRMPDFKQHTLKSAGIKTGSGLSVQLMR